MAHYLFVTGGVTPPPLGKGITAASIGRWIRMRQVHAEVQGALLAAR
ncbi:MAG: hypothetical protein WCK58_05265 [Chloroflexota bacterium]